MRWTEIVWIILGSGLMAALLTQVLEGIRLKRQFRHERRLRLDEMRREAYVENVLYLKRLPQRLVNGLAAYAVRDAATMRELQDQQHEEGTAARAALSLCQSDQVRAIFDGKLQDALDGFNSKVTQAPRDDLVLFTEEVNGAAREHISPFIAEILEAMASDFRE